MKIGGHKGHRWLAVAVTVTVKTTPINERTRSFCGRKVACCHNGKQPFKCRFPFNLDSRGGKRNPYPAFYACNQNSNCP